MAEEAHATAMEAVAIAKLVDLATDELLERVAALEQRSMLDEDGGNDGDDESGGAKTVKKKRDNALAVSDHILCSVVTITDLSASQDAVRACMRSQMHITGFDAKSLPAPLGNGEFWEEVELEVSGEHVVQRMLRPDWQRTWEENKRVWLLELIERIQTDGWRYSTYPKDKLADTSSAAIEKHINTWFKGVASKYNALHPKTTKQKSEEDPKERTKKNGRKREVRTACHDREQEH